MLTNCQECNHQISDKAVFCPSCGLPTKQNSARRKKSRMRLPNGFGQITKIKNQNLRKPFRAMVTVGKNENGRPICKLLEPEAYFKTYNEAYSALVKFNNNPYDLGNEITIDELFFLWKRQCEKNKLSKATLKNIDTFHNSIRAVKDMKVDQVKSKNIRELIDSLKPNMQVSMKNYWNLMLDYAVEYEMVPTNYARTFNVSKETRKTIAENRKNHIAFTNKELEILWENIDKPVVDMILIQCYSGWRPGEICLLKTKDVNLTEKTFVGGLKTKNGKNRIVPIHPKIFQLVENQYITAKNIGSDFLFSDLKDDERLRYRYYFYRFSCAIEELNLNPKHRPHDPRKTFVTLAKHYNMDEYAIKRIVGHSISDLTERVYTERSVDWLRTEIEKIK